MSSGNESVYDGVRGHFLLARLNVKGIFARSVVWIYQFSETKGASGLILNRPTGTRLECCAPVFAGTPLGEIPVHTGGPVEPGRLSFLLRSREGLGGGTAVRFGVSPEEVRKVVYNPGVRAYAFVGRAEWAPGQLEDELDRGTWMRARMDSAAWDAGGSEEFRRRLLSKIRGTEAALMLSAPEALEEN